MFFHSFKLGLHDLTGQRAVQLPPATLVKIAEHKILAFGGGALMTSQRLPTGNSLTAAKKAQIFEELLLHLLFSLAERIFCRCKSIASKIRVNGDQHSQA